MSFFVSIVVSSKIKLQSILHSTLQTNIANYITYIIIIRLKCLWVLQIVSVLQKIETRYSMQKIKGLNYERSSIKLA